MLYEIEQKLNGETKRTFIVNNPDQIRNVLRRKDLWKIITQRRFQVGDVVTIYVKRVDEAL